MNKSTLQIGAHYQHYKNKKFYKILAIALNAESDPLESWVVYQALYDDPNLGSQPVFIRSVAQFTENVEFDGECCSRFQLVESSSIDTPRFISSAI
ncbi:DUF1653 domain-containing protein [Candidatus Dependentiae bacterium]|nr:DUF1653 domain-containing protein [Candidatus Dependentiae bacterium]